MGADVGDIVFGPIEDCFAIHYICGYECYDKMEAIRGESDETETALQSHLDEIEHAKDRATAAVECAGETATRAIEQAVEHAAERTAVEPRVSLESAHPRPMGEFNLIF